MKDSPYIRDIRLIWHFDALLSSRAYEEGYLAGSSFAPPYVECPYRFPLKLDRARMTVAAIDRPLSDDERKTLADLNRRFKRTKWDRWTAGNYYRHCVETN